MPKYKAYVPPEIHVKELTAEEEEEKRRKTNLDVDDSVISGFRFDEDDHDHHAAGAPAESRNNKECSVCNIGRIEKRFTIWGILMGIFLCPIGGTYCCYVSRIEVCNNCGTVFD